MEHVNFNQLKFTLSVSKMDKLWTKQNYPTLHDKCIGIGIYLHSIYLTKDVEIVIIINISKISKSIQKIINISKI
jgi:hypothetical protein